MSEGIDSRRAVAEYMSHGPETRLASFAPQQMEGWIDATNKRELPNGYQPYHAAWMRAEAAVVVGLHIKDGRDHGTGLDDYALLDDAAGRFDALASRPSNDPLLRARALISLGSMSIYKALSDSVRANSPDDVIKLGPLHDRLMEAAEVLQRLAGKRRDDPSLRHAIHVLSFMGMFTVENEKSNAVVFASPSRLANTEDQRGYDFHFWELTPEYNGIFSMRATVAETGVVNGVIQMPVGLLRESEYPSPVGHGTLAALLSNKRDLMPATGHKRQSQPASGGIGDARIQREKYFGRVFLGCAKEYIKQRYNGTTLSLEVDPIEGLDEARAWYDGLSPMRRLVSYDMDALDACLNPFENAFWAGDLSAQDVDRMGWIRAERALASGDASELERASDLFEESAQKAEEAEDWRRYCDALAAGVTTRLYGALQQDYSPDELLSEYMSDLSEVINRLHNGLEVLEGQGSMHAAYVREVYERLAACMVLSSHPEDLYIAAIAPPRQRPSGSKAFGVDIMVMPLIDDRYQLHAMGRVQLTSGGRLNSAVAAIDPAILRLAIDSIVPGEGGTLEWDETKVAAARERVMTLVEPVMFL